MLGVGCGCHLPLLALWSAPYEHGCFGKMLEADIGWPVYVDKRPFWASILDFMRGR